VLSAHTIILDGLPNIDASFVDETSALELIRNYEYEEFLCYHPQWKDMILALKSKYFDFVGKIRLLANELRAVSRKEIALRPDLQQLKFILFYLKDHPNTFLEEYL
jgi:hypothetical protein